MVKHGFQLKIVSSAVHTSLEIEDPRGSKRPTYLQFTFWCTFNGNNVQTQISIPQTLLNHTKPTTVDKFCGTDSVELNFCFSKIYFHGFNSIYSENTLKNLSDTYYNIYNAYFSFIFFTWK